MKLRLTLVALFSTLSCASALVVPERVQDPYPDVLSRLESRRVSLASRHRAAKTAVEKTAILGSARTAVFETITGEILPAWYGTPWDFNGTSQTPGEGQIACGYLVSTVLRDAGFKLERIRVAQQASANIVKTLSPEGKIRNYRNLPQAEAAQKMRDDLDDGLYVVGMDYHVGFLVLEGEKVELCHSAFVDPGGVACEPAETSLGFWSTLWVVGPALTDARMKDWLDSKAIVTVGKMRK